MAWPVTTTRTVYENAWMVVQEDEVVRPDGSAGIYGVLTIRQPAVFVVALTDADEVLLVDVDRHTVGRSLEVPAGGSDGEDLLLAARRELREETGYEATTWTRLGEMTALNGICRAPETVFLATGLSRVDDDEAAREEEGIGAVRLVPLADALDLVRDGTITDGETIAALLYALIHLGRIRSGSQG